MRLKRQKENQPCINLSQMNIIFNARDFWRKFTIWIRLYLVSRYSGFGIAEDAYNHLYDFPDEFTTMLQLVFGKEIKDKFNQLLEEQIVMLRALIDAQMDGNAQVANQNIDELYQNGYEQAKYLSEINPYWETIQWKQLISTYIKYTIAETNYISMGDFENSIISYDNLMSQSITMGDYLALGLFKYLNLESHTPYLGTSCISYDQVNTIYQIRTFWYEMAVWTRAILVGKLTGKGYSELAYERLKQNIANYGELLKKFFNDEKVNEYLQILYNYVDLVNNLINAEATGNTEEINKISTQLLENSDKRAMLLTDLNPYLDQNEWRSILNKYTKSTIDEISTFFSNDYQANINIFDDLLNQAAHTADHFSEALYYYNTTRG